MERVGTKRGEGWEERGDGGEDDGASCALGSPLLGRDRRGGGGRF